MSYKIIISILFSTFPNEFICTILHSNVAKQFEKHTKVNKGVWIKNNVQNDMSEKGKTGEFLFRIDSMELENNGQNNYDPFNLESLEASTVYTSYENRDKRSIDHKINRRFEMNPGKAANEPFDLKNRPYDKSTSKLLNNIKPATVFKDYPYEMSVFLENVKTESKEPHVETLKDDIYVHDDNNTVSLATELNYIENFLTNILNNDSLLNATLYDHNNNSTVPKRSMEPNNGYDTRIIKNIVMTETNGANKAYNNQNLFKMNDEWRQNYPVYDTHTYKIMPNTEIKKSRFVTERGLVRVLAMLTKTFKKIMRQHSSIKIIHDKLINVNEDFLNNSSLMTEKLQSFDFKYNNLLNVVEKLKMLEAKMKNRDECLKNKEKELLKTFREFELQQKKFLAQQTQFYTVQKIMLAQNEKINIKQNIIAKTQSEISVRQHNFARILKKTKQLYNDNKKLTSPKPKLLIRPKEQKKKTIKPIIRQTTTSTAQTTEFTKINLFAVPPFARAQNKDKYLLKDKDIHPVDDLVYKYYFNNTFIDYLMRNQILSNFLNSVDKVDQVRHFKQKIDDDEPESTILLPVNKPTEIPFGDSEDLAQFESLGSELHRKRRWINHHSKRMMRKKHRGKHLQANTYNIDDGKMANSKIHNENENMAIPLTKNNQKKEELNKSDPFLLMATKFCNEIGQNTNTQMLKWCVEKSLRRLKVMENLMTEPPLKFTQNIVQKSDQVVKAQNDTHLLKGQIAEDRITTHLPTETVSLTTTSSSTTIPTVPHVEQQVTKATTQKNDIFFPDNDELESKLRQLDEKPETEGNVYFDGSLHASDILPQDSGESSDLFPDLDSNSHIQVDPEAFNLMLRRDHMRGRYNRRA